MIIKSNPIKSKYVIRIGIAGLLLIVVTIIVLFAVDVLKQQNTNTNVTKDVLSNDVETTKNDDKIVHVAAMGDMLAHATIINNAKSSDGYNFAKYFQNIKASYIDADLVFCNQEGLSSGEKYIISGYPSFNAPTQFARDLQSGAGCNVINLANNHIADKGHEALVATLDAWKQLQPLDIIGANRNYDEQQIVKINDVNGIKIAFLAFNDFSNNSTIPAYSVNNYHDEDLVRKLVGQARAKADIVIVSMHWGIEDSSSISDDQIKQVTMLSDLGVDVILGTGPHVLQKVDIIDRSDGGKMVIWYSLGNMLSSQLNIKELIGGVAKFDIVKEGDGDFLVNNLSFVPTYMHYEWTKSQQDNYDLLARTNAMIYLLDDASSPLSRSLFDTTVEAQKQYVIDTIGSKVTIK